MQNIYNKNVTFLLQIHLLACLLFRVHSRTKTSSTSEANWISAPFTNGTVRSARSPGQHATIDTHITTYSRFRCRYILRSEHASCPFWHRIKVKWFAHSFSNRLTDWAIHLGTLRPNDQIGINRAATIHQRTVEIVFVIATEIVIKVVVTPSKGIIMSIGDRDLQMK